MSLTTDPAPATDAPARAATGSRGRVLRAVVWASFVVSVVASAVAEARGASLAVGAALALVAGLGLVAVAVVHRRRQR